MDVRPARTPAELAAAWVGVDTGNEAALATYAAAGAQDEGEFTMRGWPLAP
ncbi:hypothetical protein [Streptomyces sp. NPDC090022]|uniref:hypothetical protein n=1 Tax=Streptomyces sp. NPDC090022 TaxID=3365920 RepID=UPI0038138072